MTIQEAVQAGISRVRLPHWAADAYIDLPLLPDGRCGPWATVVDPSGQETLFMGTLLKDSDNRYESATRKETT